jgi:glycosyltransferase involved in cell wall biosynthesis
VSSEGSEPGPPGLLRLCIVFHESEALGAGRSVLNSLPELQELGWRASGWFPGSGALIDEAAGLLAASRVESKPIAYSARGWRAAPGIRSRVTRTPRYLREFRRALLSTRPHVVHINTLRALPEAYTARALGIPVVLHVHELPDAGMKSTAALRAAALTADVLVAVSDAVASRIRGHVGRTPVVVVANGVPPLRVERAPIPGTVGTIGTIARTKGTDVFFEAALIARAESPDLRFEHVGHRMLDNDAEFATLVDELAASPALEGSARLLGPQPAAVALARWEIFVLPSRQDSFPLASLEAMQAGLPVIASDVGGIPEQITHLQTGILVRPEDPKALADWIVRLHREPDLRQTLGDAAAERVRTAFTPERQARGLHRAYLAALNLKHAPPPVRQATLEAL